MPSPSAITNAGRPRNPLVRWLLGAGALVAILAATWQIFHAAPPRTESPAPALADRLAPNPPAQAEAGSANWAAAAFTIAAPDGLRQTAENSWSIKGGRAFLQVHLRPDTTRELRFVYPLGELLPEETNALLRIRWSLGATESIVQRLAITPEQIVQLHAVSPVTDIQVSRADRQKLEDLFGDYLSAGDKGPAEKALVAAVGEIDAHYFAATMQHISGLAAQVRQIFSEEQWAGLAKRFGNPGAGARGPR